MYEFIKILKNFFIKAIFFILKPKKWIEAYSRRKENLIKIQLWKDFDKLLKNKLFLKSNKNGNVILVDGLWDNPNHFFRLRIFLESLLKKEKIKLVAFLSDHNSRSKETLTAMGFDNFFYISDFPVEPKDKILALKTLKNVKTHKDLLEIKLPENLPSYILYDTVLKISKNPQTKLSSDLWVENLADLYRLNRFYNHIFKSQDVKKIVLSHIRKNEFGLLLMKALKRKITCFNIYSLNEMIRIKRFDNVEDLNKPIEVFSFSKFSKLDNVVKKSITKYGRDYLKQKSFNKNSDINFTRAYGREKKKINLKEKLSIKEGKIVVTVFFHAWYDFPHVYGMKNFTDFLDWTYSTLKIAKKRKDIIWLLKPHPCESWYGGFFLTQVAKNLPSNIHVLNESTSVTTVLDISDFSVTVHGTVAVESTEKGVPVICADKTCFDDWNFFYSASSKSDYENKLLGLNKNSFKVTKEMVNNASICAYLTMAPANKETKIAKLISDHFPPSKLFSDLFKIIKFDNSYVYDQSNLITKWLESETNDFCIYHKINLHKQFCLKSNN